MKPKRHRDFFEKRGRKSSRFRGKYEPISNKQLDEYTRHSVNDTSMNFTITIDNSNEEVIDLDSSQDTISDASNSRTVRFVKGNSLPDDIANDSDTASPNVDDNGQNSKSLSYKQQDTSKPVFKVMFRDESVSRQYRKQIKDFLEQLISSKDANQEDDDSCNLTLEIWESDADSIIQPIDITTESEDSQNIECESLFMVDTKPKLQDELDVPTYKKRYKNVFEESNVKVDTTSNDECESKLMCFNCLENHNLRDCTKPRNQTNIMKNRKEQQKRGTSKGVRYHLDGDQRFGYMVPGQLSNTLRDALGIRDNELPKHIYRMRVLGYPPGWLEEARLQHSGISLFNSEGIAESDSGAVTKSIPNDKDKDQYDVKKIYDFPGFNVPPPPGIHDDNKQYWTSHIQFLHSKQRMLLMLQDKKADDGYKRKKLRISNVSSNDDSVAIPSEMEIEDVEESVVECLPVNELFLPPLPQETSVKPPEPPPLPPPSPSPQQPSSQTISEDSGFQSQELQFLESPEISRIKNGENTSSPIRPNSPSLFDLENMKKRLLIELEDSSSQQNPDTQSNNSSLNSTMKSDMPPPSNETTPQLNRSHSRNALNTSHGNVKSVDFGTPVLQSTSPYSKLPSAEKFSKNICDVINFENLPDYTGKYERMTELLQKVRNTCAKIHQE